MLTSNRRSIRDNRHPNPTPADNALLNVIGDFGAFEFPLASRYRFHAKLGSGATGVVYRALDLRLGRTVAIKVLHRVITQELGIARFQAEVRLAAALRHDAIAVIHDYDESEDRLYYVMEFIAGETLRTRIETETRLPLNAAVRIVRQIGDALEYAHDHGVVHRDVKPENIMLAGDRAWLVDFGLAIAIGTLDKDRLTASGLTVGTPAYMSPEQAAGERAIGPATDQYALGCVLFEMLTGSPPFAGPTAGAIIGRQLSEVPPRVRSVRRDITRTLDDTVARALKKDPSDRFPRVGDFVDAVCPSADRGAASETAAPTRVTLRHGIVAAIALVAVILGVLSYVAFRR